MTYFAPSMEAACFASVLQLSCHVLACRCGTGPVLRAAASHGGRYVKETLERLQGTESLDRLSARLDDVITMVSPAGVSRMARC